MLPVVERTKGTADRPEVCASLARRARCNGACGEPSEDDLRCADPADAPGRRTLFAITLQLGRCVADLVALVHVGFHPVLGRAALNNLADAIERGARRRERELLPSAVDMQRRVEPLTTTRPPMRHGAALKKIGRAPESRAA